VACDSLCVALVIGISAAVILVLSAVVIAVIVACRRRGRQSHHPKLTDPSSPIFHTTVVTVGGRASGDYSEIPNAAFTPTSTPSLAHDNPDYIHIEPPEPDYLHLPESDCETPTFLTTL